MTLEKLLDQVCDEIRVVIIVKHFEFRCILVHRDRRARPDDPPLQLAQPQLLDTLQGDLHFLQQNISQVLLVLRLEHMHQKGLKLPPVVLQHSLDQIGLPQVVHNVNYVVVIELCGSWLPLLEGPKNVGLLPIIKVVVYVIFVLLVLFFDLIHDALDAA